MQLTGENINIFHASKIPPEKLKFNDIFKIFVFAKRLILSEYMINSPSIHLHTSYPKKGLSINILLYLFSLLLHAISLLLVCKLTLVSLDS